MEYPIQERLNKDYKKNKKELALKRLEKYKNDPKFKKTCLAHNLEWQIKNPEKAQLHRINYWKKNKDKVYNRHREWIKQNPDKAKQYRLNYKLSLREAVYSHYGKKCNCCGEVILKFLTIDHVNNDGYKERTVILGKSKPAGDGIFAKIIKEGFPKKYQVLCMNCNLGKSRNNGICPHKDIKI